MSCTFVFSDKCLTRVDKTIIRIKKIKYTFCIYALYEYASISTRYVHLRNN